jgi:nucleotide-binding universal stress UspA family protein
MRIVAGLDGTAPSMIAHQLLSSTRWPRGSVIRIVTPYASTAGTGDRVPFDAGVLAADRGVGDTMLWMQEGLAPPLRRGGVAVELETTPSPGSSVLLDAARKFDADLIVVGNHVTEAASAGTNPPVIELVERAQCPVLVARMPRVTRILLAVDGSPGADAMPWTMRRWHAFDDTHIDVVSVIPPSTATSEFVTPWAPITPSDCLELAFERHRAMASATARHLVSAGQTATPTVRAGLPAHEIVDAADAYGADMIAIASRGRDGERGRRIGSVAREVLVRARASVLLMRAGGVGARQEPKIAWTDTTLVGA